ncbi:M20/M25/M40 family metallo-hydrolase [Jiangella mangrovi]|uniref:Acetylornithine deacetylase/succinyl-diaminopimelate desuccinylase-like protein n=1 Tax=Jiangella mangrovi TaxID=1524084 RepID=A0A7W9LJI6_9ACTN|nr:M20/M25/M40 family metallo-hydrolase [Jiangella mangrovi]MBB5786131.1 acetylornithine deacetylase/succinyl-diaminopimelate desuccinylase-like protein [Jiangella mangrovi]
MAAPSSLTHALAELERLDAAGLLTELIETPSPTGAERPLAERLAARFRAAGLPADVRPVGGESANVVVGGEPDGRPSLLIYGQLDTTFSGDTDQDRPLLAGRADPEFRPVAERSGDWMLGLGAENPKGYLAAGVLAMLALAAAGQPRNVQVVGGFCAAGMPALPLGFGRGVRALLAGVAPVTAAIVPKPGFAASWEEVGIAVYRLTVEGGVGYTGIRGYEPEENTVAQAARVVGALEHWFADYGDRFATEYCRPRGAVVAISGGDPARPAFWPETCTIDVDLRLPPGVAVQRVDDELRAEVVRIVARLGVAVSVERVQAVPGATTSPGAPVVRSAVAAWEDLTGDTHEPRTATSGYTDAVVLRAAGVDTVRAGMPRPPRRDGGPPFSMGAVHLPSLLTLAEWLVRTVTTYDQHEGAHP